ncbi:uncharacterized protein LOC110286442 [Mus caroli]|uniref:Uncharacterized protein LOC110286442 n=1 Tax=Mus caroli TaxID=10089 RepID=A0A6P5NY23_MUSCR|nr:uncharacterized protein LOC110286442 [Mus caroli]
MDEKLTKVYYARSRSFWNYPPLKSATRKYNYLTPKKRLKVQKVREVVDDDPFAYPQSYSPTSPVRRREGYNQDMENIEPMDCTLPLQYTDTIDNSQTFQYTDTVDLSQNDQNTDVIDLDQTVQYTDTIDLSQTLQNTDVIDLDQTVQYTDTTDLSQTLQNTDVIDLDQTVQYTDTIDLSQTLQNTDVIDLDQTIQYTDTIDLSQTLQNTDTIDLSQTLQNTDTVNNAQPLQYTNTVNNTMGIQNTENNDVFHSENSQEAVLVRSSPERDYQETPPSPTYTTQSYEQYYRLRNVPGSSTMPFYRKQVHSLQGNSSPYGILK